MVAIIVIVVVVIIMFMGKGKTSSNTKNEINNFAKALNTQNDKNSVLAELEKTKRKFLFFNNNCINDVCNDLGLEGKKGLALSLLLAAYEIAESGEKPSLAEFAETFKVNATEDAVKNKIITLMNNIDETVTEILNGVSVTS